MAETWRWDPLCALRAVADAPTVCFLDGGSRGGSLLALPKQAVALQSLDDLPPATNGRCDLAVGGWPVDLAGAGGVLQLDYEFPVGANAHRLTNAGTVRGWYWPCPTWLRWPPGGPVEVGGDDVRAQTDLLARLASAPEREPVGVVATEPQGAWDGPTHRRLVERIQGFIAAGDIYQANLTLPFRAEVASSAEMDLACFLALRRRSDAGFAAFLRHDGRSIISHSPECFLAADGEHLISRPIKGTRRREPGCEDRTRAALLASTKDRAELAMIVDLVRNDLGRVAHPGSVRVVEPAGILDLEYVHHLEATVAVRLGADHDLRDCLAAAFPAGSITGAPKIRAMEILADLESGPRGPYCGCFGWVASPRHFALAVAIRTMVATADRIRFDAGGGIVSDSDGDAEWEEVRAKATVMAAALGAVKVPA